MGRHQLRVQERGGGVLPRKPLSEAPNLRPPKKLTKDQEAHGAEKRILSEIATRLKSFGLTAFVGSEREGDMTKLKVKGDGGIEAVVTAAAGTRYEAEGGEKHHQVEVELRVIEPIMKLTIDVHDPDEVRNGAAVVARSIADTLQRRDEETGGDAESTVEDLEAEGFGNPVTFRSDKLGPGWVRTADFENMVKAEVEVAAKDKVRVTVYMRTANSREAAVANRVITLPKDDAVGFVWDQLTQMCGSLRRAYPGAGASEAFDRLCRRESVAEAVSRLLGVNRAC